MKLTKYIGVALAVLALSSCESNNVEDYPTLLGPVNTKAGVTVSVDPTYNVNENEKMVEIPVNVTGETNGKVVVTVSVKQTAVNPGAEGAKEVEHYNITSKTINIPEGETTGFLEVTPVWEPGVINADRQFEVTITSAQGATVAAEKTCLVTIVNVDDAYTMMVGKWTLTAESAFGAGAYTTVIDLQTLPAGDPDYGTELDGFGFKAGASYTYLPLSFEYDEASQQMNVSIMTGVLATTSIINFTGLGQCVVATSSDTSKQGFGPDIVATTANFDEIIFPEDEFCLLVVLPYPAMNQILGFWDGWKNIKLTRNK